MSLFYPTKKEIITEYETQIKRKFKEIQELEDHVRHLKGQQRLDIPQKCKPFSPHKTYPYVLTFEGFRKS